MNSNRQLGRLVPGVPEGGQILVVCGVEPSNLLCSLIHLFSKFDAGVRFSHLKCSVRFSKFECCENVV